MHSLVVTATAHTTSQGAGLTCSSPDLAEGPSEKGTDGAHCKFNENVLHPAEDQMVSATHVAKQ